MSTYTTVRGKTVKLGLITLAVDVAGNLDIQIARNLGPPLQMSVSEAVASDLYNLLGDVMEWESQKGSTENAVNREGEAEAETGELDDSGAASNK